MVGDKDGKQDGRVVVGCKVLVGEYDGGWVDGLADGGWVDGLVDGDWVEGLIVD